MTHTHGIRYIGPGDYAAVLDCAEISYHSTAIEAQDAARNACYDLIQHEARYVAQAVEVAAAEADLEHDVVQAAVDADVVSALGVERYRQGPCITCGAPRWKPIHRHGFEDSHPFLSSTPVADAEVERLADAMPPRPPFLYYSSNMGGWTWGGASDAYPDHIAAAVAQREWMDSE